MAAQRHVRIVHQDSDRVLVERARWCESRLCRLRGFMFRRRLLPEEALLLVHPEEGILASSIHMLFVFTSLAALWINERGLVTSAQLAKPWRPYYASPEPARYVLEGTPDLLERIAVGDRVRIVALTAKPAA